MRSFTLVVEVLSKSTFWVPFSIDEQAEGCSRLELVEHWQESEQCPAVPRGAFVGPSIRSSSLRRVSLKGILRSTISSCRRKYLEFMLLTDTAQADPRFVPDKLLSLRKVSYIYDGYVTWDPSHVSSIHHLRCLRQGFQTRMALCFEKWEIGSIL